MNNDNLQNYYLMSRGPFSYIENTPFAEPTYPENPNVRIQGTGDSLDCSQSLIDQNSDLLNINRIYTRCPESRYMPKCHGVDCDSSGAVVQPGKKGIETPIQGAKCGEQHKKNFPVCDLTTENTHLTMPCRNSERSLNRWDWLPCNPQANVEIPFDHNIQYRNIVKDNHRPCLPVPLDQNLCLPQGLNVGVTSNIF